ncbi:MAG: ExbD/TolR family protein [Halanaerobium sp.]
MKYQPRKKESTLNLAPMIDIVFLLLIFFLVSSTLQGEEALYNIIVPDSNLGSANDTEIIELFIDQDNQYFYNENQYSEAELGRYLSANIEIKEDKSVKIYADKKSDFDSVISLIQLLKDNNFDKISFVLRKENN